ncbi:hypothetical protein SADUNF_Sadunf17G0063500 [Salix dunnii]|uniref:Uncharacterized protein n=1 Tax=Salix dunnii TaxID=1413687 RepID=A0A835J874_9ROSI|nr:hypothetical protein SADUNF_Sadunf17G0063500 [Salix dunnii]
MKLVYVFLYEASSFAYAVIAPGSLYLEAMVKTVEPDLETEFSSSPLDIIGLGVSNYDSVSVTKESPVIDVWQLKGAIQGSCIGPHGAQLRLPLWVRQ